MKSIKMFLLSLSELAYLWLTSFMAQRGLIMFAVSLPNGTLIAMAASYGASKTMSAVSNANPAVATLAASHGVIVGDIMEVTSGWSKLTDRVVRASVVATNDVSLEGINSTSTGLFPAGGGAGSIREVLTWTQLAQILNSTSEGGEQQFTTYQFLESDSQKRIPTFKNPRGLNLTIADDPTLAGYILADAANDDRLPRAIRATLPSGGLIYYNAYVSLDKTPTLTVNEIMAVTVTLSLLSDPVRYTS